MFSRQRTRLLKIAKVLLREQSILLFQIKKSLNPENLEVLEKSGKNPEKIWIPDEIPEKKIIISNLRSKPLIV